MGARALLQEMLSLLQSQTEAVVAGTPEALTAGAQRHEELLRQLESAAIDLEPDELTSLVAEIDREKMKLRSLLESESIRVDFLLRLVLGGKQAGAGGYPTGHWQTRPAAQQLNRRA